jgi:hypothetical protein
MPIDDEDSELPELVPVVVTVRVSPFALQEATAIGFKAGRDDRAMRYQMPARLAPNYFKVFTSAVDSLKARDVFPARYAPRLDELACQQARSYAILLTKISEQASNELYAGCKTANIKYISNARLAKYVDKVLPRPLFEQTLLQPIHRAFWTGWQEGVQLERMWLAAMGRRRQLIAPITA